MSERVSRTAIELAAFFALAWFAAAHWAHGLVDGAPGARMLAIAVIALAAGLALVLTAGMRRVIPALALRAAVVASALPAALVAAGLERRLLAPRGWDELADGIDRGFAALGSVEWPYAGPEPWARLALLLAPAIICTLAAACAFWPRRDGARVLRPLALVLLLVLYGVAVTEHRFPGELGRGVALLALVACWLWLPRLPAHGGRVALAAAAGVLVACLLALPAAARYRDSEPWVDYDSWNPFQAASATSFDWTHSYGPLGWPRDGTTLMNVRSARPHYWKVQTLDRFDGLRWVASGLGRGGAVLLPERLRDQWDVRVRVTIRDLETDFFPVVGTAYRIEGAAPVVLYYRDGTAEALGDSIDSGDSYEVRAYVPDPSPRQLRAAPAGYPVELAESTYLHLPRPGETAREGDGLDGEAARPLAELESPLLGGSEEAERALLGSPYAEVYRLARRLAAGRRTTYDVVRALLRHLRSDYDYSERPPTRDYPLAGFLLEDRSGYCQQFSGALALMLRMLGIPSRVAGGFSPGSYNRDTREYRVRDFDAHSWVEVWFSGIGWVPFDPTPATAPAESQSSGADAASAATGAGPEGERRSGERDGQSSGPLSDRAGDRGAPARVGDALVRGWTAIALLLALALAAAVALRLRAVRAARRRATSDDPVLAELRAALERLGRTPPPGATLRQLERELGREAGPAVARYVRLLRERRYAPAGGRAPDLRERRQLRRALARGGGWRRRVRAYLALPPRPPSRLRRPAPERV